MRRGRPLAAGFACLLLCAADTASGAKAADAGVAVVELFTSEGCSSCPSADALLAEKAAEARRTDRPVFALSFHVDYWDRLGWKDPYASPAYTLRQEAYAQRLGLRSLYTPQAVVNGTRECVGSDRRRIDQAIEAALSQPAPVAVTLTARVDRDHVVTTHVLSRAPTGGVLCVAWVDNEAESTPSRGENGGRRLRHANVVRDFAAVNLQTNLEGTVSLRRQGVKAGTIIGYVQDAPAGRVLGAHAVSPTSP